MTDDKTPRVFMGSLHFNAAVSAGLGMLLGEFAVMEFLIAKILSTILGENDEKMPFAYAITGNIQSISVRLDIIEEALRRGSMDATSKSKFTNAISALRTVNTLRNEYVHAVYETNVDTGEVTRTTWISSTRRAQKTGTITVASVNLDRDKIQRTHGEIMRSLFPHELSETQTLPEIPR